MGIPYTFLRLLLLVPCVGDSGGPFWDPNVTPATILAIVELGGKFCGKDATTATKIAHPQILDWIENNWIKTVTNKN